MKNKMRLGLLGIIFYSILNTAYSQTIPESGTPPTINFSICANADKLFSMKNEAPTTLELAKQFLIAVSSFTVMNPRSEAENILKLKSADGLIFYCQDLSVSNDFAAQIFFTYKQDQDQVKTPPIQLHMVPPDQPRPQPLTMPEEETKDANEAKAPESQPVDYSNALK